MQPLQTAKLESNSEGQVQGLDHWGVQPEWEATLMAENKWKKAPRVKDLTLRGTESAEHKEGTV